MTNHNLIDKQNDFTSYSQYNLNQEQFKPINNLEQLSECIKSSSNNVKKYSKDNKLVFLTKNDMNVVEEKNPVNLKSIL